MSYHQACRQVFVAKSMPRRLSETCYIVFQLQISSYMRWFYKVYCNYTSYNTGFFPLILNHDPQRDAAAHKM